MAQRSTTTTTATPSAATFLIPLKLDRYIEKFDEEGADDPDMMMEYSMAELMEEFGMKKMHAAKLCKWLNRYENETMNIPTYPPITKIC